MLFIKKNKKYYFLNEFENIEEIEESKNRIDFNLSQIKFKTTNRKFSTKNICINLDKRENKAKQIKLPEELKVITQEKIICTKKIPKITMKLLIQIELRIK